MTTTREAARKRRHTRVRGKVFGTPDRPRLNVFRSSKHMYAQVIDDVHGHTLAAASTSEAELQEQLESTGNKDGAALVGQVVAERAKEVGISEVVFDRGGYKYHGRVKALAEAAREAGLEF